MFLNIASVIKKAQEEMHKHNGERHGGQNGKETAGVWSDGGEFGGVKRECGT